MLSEGQISSNAAIDYMLNKRLVGMFAKSVAGKGKSAWEYYTKDILFKPLVDAHDQINVL